MYILEGNTGVGKSTFLKLLAQHCPDVHVIPEPKDSWAAGFNGRSLLGNFYDDRQRWAYTMETFTMACRVKEHTKEQANPNPNRVMERSVYSGHFCFALNGHKDGMFNSIEWDIYKQWVDFLMRKACKPPLGFIYLKAQPEVCFGRLQKRNRVGEENISLDYMKQIDFWHDKFLLEKDGIFPELKSVPVLIIDCNQDFVQNSNRMQEHAQRVAEFLKQTQNETALQTKQTYTAATLF